MMTISGVADSKVFVDSKLKSSHKAVEVARLKALPVDKEGVVYSQPITSEKLTIDKIQTPFYSRRLGGFNGKLAFATVVFLNALSSVDSQGEKNLIDFPKPNNSLVVLRSDLAEQDYTIPILMTLYFIGFTVLGLMCCYVRGSRECRQKMDCRTQI